MTIQNTGSATTRITVGSAGAITIAAPSSGNALTVNGAAGYFTGQFYAGSLGTTAGNSVGILYLNYASGNNDQLVIQGKRITSGSDWTHASLTLTKIVDSTTHGYITFGDGGASTFAGTQGVTIGSTGRDALMVDSAGHVTIVAPSSGTMLNLGGSIYSGEFSGATIGTISLGQYGGVIGDSFSTNLTFNTYYNGGANSFQYKNTNVASYIRMDSSGINLNVIPSGTALANVGTIHNAVNVSTTGVVTIYAPTTGTTALTVNAAISIYNIGASNNLQIFNDGNPHIESASGSQLWINGNYSSPLSLCNGGGITYTGTGGVVTYGSLTSTGIGVGTSQGQINMVYGSGSTWYNVMWRNDASNFYWLVSAAQTTQYLATQASWNSLRPFTISMAGYVTIGDSSQGCTVNCGLYVANSLGVGTGYSGTTGEIRATNNVTAYYSDKRLKRDFRSIDGALDRVLRLNGVFFRGNEVAAQYGYDTEKVQVGVIAQDVQRELPMAVFPAPFDRELVDGVERSKSGEEYLTVQYDKLVPLLIEAIKELTNRVKELEKINDDGK